MAGDQQQCQWTLAVPHLNTINNRQLSHTSPHHPTSHPIPPHTASHLTSHPTSHTTPPHTTPPHTPPHLTSHLTQHPTPHHIPPHITSPNPYLSHLCLVGVQTHQCPLDVPTTCIFVVCAQQTCKIDSASSIRHVEQGFSTSE